MEKLNVAIADDNEKMLDLLGNLINEDQELELVGHASNGAENIRYYQGERAGCSASGYYNAESGRTHCYGAGGKRR